MTALGRYACFVACAMIVGAVWYFFGIEWAAAIVLALCGMPLAYRLGLGAGEHHDDGDGWRL